MKPKPFADDQVKIILDYIDLKTAPINNLVTKADIKHLPTKNEYYSKMDELMGEIKANREERVALAGIITRHEDQLNNHSRRIKKLESNFLTS